MKQTQLRLTFSITRTDLVHNFQYGWDQIMVDYRLNLADAPGSQIAHHPTRFLYD